MSDPRARLLELVRRLEDVEDRPSPVSGGSALFYRGKEFAHFHDVHELDLRLGKKVIQELGLSHPSDSAQHPDRSPNSPWIELRLQSPSDVKRVLALIERAVSGM